MTQKKKAIQDSPAAPAAKPSPLLVTRVIDLTEYLKRFSSGTQIVKKLQRLFIAA